MYFYNKERMTMKDHAGSRIIIAALLTIAVSLQCFPFFAYAQIDELSSEQRNAVAMLNYITVLTQDINASKNSRLYMEDAYSSLINNTYPNAVDSRTQSQLSNLLDIMEKYRMIDVKRGRLQYIFQQNQADAIRAAISNPKALLSKLQSFDLSMIAASIVYMAVDSASSYISYSADTASYPSETDLEYLEGGWTLDDEEAAALYNSRKETFSYMISMVRDQSLPGDLTLTENSVEEFVKWKNNDNIAARIQFLESNQNIYTAYGGYWLVLAETYYSHGDYFKCIDAIHEYENMHTRIFRYDYELAKILPLVISAAGKVYTDEVYNSFAAHYAQIILDNTNHDQWALRYFAAQTYVNLFANTQNMDYLQKAYDIVLDNANYLTEEQESLNADYLSAVKTVSKPKNATKDEKKEIDKYNKMIKNNRRTELPPVYEPLRLNCDLLFAIASEMGISESEQTKIDAILHPNGKRLFLTVPLDDNYIISQKAEPDPISDENEIEFYGNYMVLPVVHVTDDAAITVTVRDNTAAQETVLSDWKIDKVEREKEDDISTFFAVFNSADGKNVHWVPDMSISIEILPKQEAGLSPYTYQYTTVGTKNEWYDYLKVWEGHKNHWYEYAKVWENSVVFERAD